MGTIGKSMSSSPAVDNKVATMGSTAAKDKLVSSSFSIEAGQLHFGLNGKQPAASADSGGETTVHSTASSAKDADRVNRNHNLPVLLQPQATPPSDAGLVPRIVAAAVAAATGSTSGGGGGDGPHYAHSLPGAGGSEHLPGTPNLRSISKDKRSVVPPKPPPKPVFVQRLARQAKANRLRRPLQQRLQQPLTLAELWLDERFLTRFFAHFNSSLERSALAQVCSTWRNILYQPRFWSGIVPVMYCREFRNHQHKALKASGSALGVEDDATRERRQRFYLSLQQRGFDAICLCGANDDDVADFVANCPSAAKHTHHVILRCSSITDKGLEALLDGMQSVYQLELSGCNEVSEAGLWSSLNPRIVALSISDCINIADESLGAVAQLLPSLYEFNLQAYHVTDAALAFFSTKQSVALNVLRLQSCWEISNQGVSNLVHALPNLTILSLAGCSKITDAGVEVIAENLRKLKCLDLSWCPRITDAALEYIACDLTLLEELSLDRCVHITDIGIGYISTMLSLNALFLRWCTQIRDFGLQHLCSMRNLQVLSVAGCPLLTASGLSAMIQLRHLRELELTNCPGASTELFDYLHQHLPQCNLIE